MQGMTIEEGESKCYDQSVIDDDRLETTEYTGLALHLKSFTAYTLVHEKPATIEIVDNDCEYKMPVSDGGTYCVCCTPQLLL